MSHFLTVKAFCADYQIGRTRAYELIRDGAIQAMKSGRRTLIVAASAQAWAASLPRLGARS